MKTGFCFDETMAGTMERVDRPGERVPFSFTVHVHAESLARHLRDGKASLRGVVEAPGLAACAPAEGSMVLRPLRGKIIGYDLAFRGDDGASYRFRGQKDIRYRDLLRSWTTLPGEITDDAGR